MTENARSIRPYGSFGAIGRMISRSAFYQLQHSAWLLLGTILGLAITYRRSAGSGFRRRPDSSLRGRGMDPDDNRILAHGALLFALPALGCNASSRRVVLCRRNHPLGNSILVGPRGRVEKPRARQQARVVAQRCCAGSRGSDQGVVFGWIRDARWRIARGKRVSQSFIHHLLPNLILVSLVDRTLFGIAPASAVLVG